MPTVNLPLCHRHTDRREKRSGLAMQPWFLVVAFVFALLISSGGFCQAQIEKNGTNLFRQDNLMAWCIVPFDGKKRTPEERAQMLKELKISKFAYDYRAEHIPTFEREIQALKENGIELSAWWFPTQMNPEAKSILELLAKHQLKPQLWVMGSGKRTMTPEEENQFVASEVARIGAIADAANAIGCKVGLYNHGGWFGVPENMVRLVRELKRPNVGIVYNLHHAHEELERLPEVLQLLKPYLLVLNVNGMETAGDQVGKKILVIGEGNRDRWVFEVISKSGYEGPIGILNHTNEDARTRLDANLAGLRQVTAN